MTSEGMIEVNDLSGSLIESSAMEEGSVVSATYEGSRPVFFEIQALVAHSSSGAFGRRTALGVNYNRVSMILAVLEKKAGLALTDYDVYVNVVGGMKSESTATDLAVALALYSSCSGKHASKRIVAVGEIGLTGNLRSIPNADKIVQEAIRLGYDAIILPKKNADQIKNAGKSGDSIASKSLDGIASGKLEILGADNVREAIKYYTN